jgi:2-polyprenyl-3-methyl-5-hydroxy-6-metoxy-1,4-benzoquinol methylase
MEMIPPRHYRRALDLGCGIGLFTERLAQRCDEVVGIDISNSALQYAIRRMHALENVRMQQGDVLALDPELNGAFDLVVIADTIYYLPTPLHDLTLHRLVHGLRGLLAANGILMVVNHYFPLPNASSRLTRRIHAAFESSRDLSMLAEHKRAFYLTGVFANTPRATLDVRATACAGPY